MVDVEAFELLVYIDGRIVVGYQVFMSNFVLSSDLIEVDFFGYYDESKESVTGYPQKRPGWILAEDVFFVARVSFGIERAMLTSP